MHFSSSATAELDCAKLIRGKTSCKRPREAAWPPTNPRRTPSVSAPLASEPKCSNQVKLMNFYSTSNLAYFSNSHLEKRCSLGWFSKVLGEQKLHYTSQERFQKGRENSITGTHGYSWQTHICRELMQHLLVPQFFASLHHLSEQNLEELFFQISE